MAGDIRERSGAEAIVGAALQRHLLLNNAGGQYFVPAEGITAKGRRAVQRLNVGGTLAMSDTAYELAMRPAGTGTIVKRDRLPPPRHAGDGAHRRRTGRGDAPGRHRQPVESITLEQARCWASDGISVVAITLGRLASESLRKYPAELWPRAPLSVPLQRLGKAEEYGWLVALLATPPGPRSRARS